MKAGEVLKLKAGIVFLLTAAREIQSTTDRMVRKMHPSDPQEEFLMALALNLMHYYSALEDILAHITAVFDEYRPSGTEWHRGLLQLATLETPTRPAILSQETYQALDTYRRFHHVVRKAYLKRLEWSRMRDLVDESSELLTVVREDMDQFIVCLEGAIRQIQQEE